MSWFVADDNLSEHPKVLDLLEMPCGLSAMGFWLLCGTWCRRMRKSGDVRRTAADAQARKAKLSDASELAAALVQVGLWEVTDEGWRFIDWDDVYKDDAKQAEDRAKDAKRKKDERAAAKAKKLAESAHRPDASDGRPPDIRACPGPSPSPLPSPLSEGPREDAQRPEESKPQSVPPARVPHIDDPANSQGYDTGGYLLEFQNAFNAESKRFGWEIPPETTRDQMRAGARRAGKIKHARGIPFPEAAVLMVRQAFQDARELNKSPGLALLDAEPGKPKLARAGAKPHFLDRKVGSTTESFSDVESTADQKARLRAAKEAANG